MRSQKRNFFLVHKFGKWQKDLENDTQILLVIEGFNCCSIVGEIEWQIFLPYTMCQHLLAWQTKFREIEPLDERPNVDTVSLLVTSVRMPQVENNLRKGVFC